MKTLILVLIIGLQNLIALENKSINLEHQREVEELKEDFSKTLSPLAKELFKIDYFFNKEKWYLENDEINLFKNVYDDTKDLDIFLIKVIFYASQCAMEKMDYKYNYLNEKNELDYQKLRQLDQLMGELYFAQKEIIIKSLKFLLKTDPKYYKENQNNESLLKSINDHDQYSLSDIELFYLDERCDLE